MTSLHASWWDERWADACQLRSGSELLIVMREREPVAGIEGIAFRLQRLTFPGRKLIHDCVFGLPQIGVEELVVSPSEELALAFLNSGKGECGYELFAIRDGIRRVGVGQPFTLSTMLSPPVFSPDDRFVVSATASGAEPWWADRDDDDRDWKTPSRGGRVTFGFLVVHEIEKNRVTRHQLEVELEQGWIPRDPRDSRWAGPEGVEFVDDNRVEVGLPDGSDVELELPLTEAVLLPTPDRDA